MRTIKKGIFHTTYTFTNATVSGIVKYWREKRKWKHNGYHIIVDRQGVAHILEPFHAIANGVQGENSDSINVAWMGGRVGNDTTVDNRTPKQKATLKNIAVMLKSMFPDIKFYGHRVFNPDKTCPNFDTIELDEHVNTHDTLIS